MRYLFILDHQHLDNGGFLKLLSKKMGSRSMAPFMMIHGDSAYTERIIQTGMMRDDATVRAIKELNHRLTALFADEGVPLISMNAYQRGILAFVSSNNWTLDTEYLKNLGTKTNILLSNLTQHDEGELKPMPLDQLASLLHDQLHFEHIIAFDASESVDEIFVKSEENGAESQIIAPEELRNSKLPLKIMKLSEFEKSLIFSD